MNRVRSINFGLFKQSNTHRHVSTTLTSLKASCGRTIGRNQLFANPNRFYSVPRPSKSGDVIVFDIDDTLCLGVHSETESAGDVETQYRNPECDIIQLKYEDYSSWYVFRPYFGVMLNQLLQHKARIAFFSAGIEERNTTLIHEILHRHMSPEVYKAAVAAGQFQVFSRHHMRRVAEGGDEPGVKVFDEGHRVKDLTPIMNKDTETLDDMILIDDNPAYCAKNQHVCIFTPGSLHEVKDNAMEIKDLHMKNNFYYFIGVFKTYFESDKYKDMPLRQAISDVIKLDNRYDAKHCIPDLSFEIGATLVGLQEVRKTYPEAVFYGSANYLKQFSKIPQAVFHHPMDAAERILDDILTGKRKVSEPTIYMFLRYLDEDGMHYYMNTVGEAATSVMKEKFLKVAALLNEGSGGGDGSKQ